MAMAITSNKGNDTDVESIEGNNDHDSESMMHLQGAHTVKHVIGNSHCIYHTEILCLQTGFTNSKDNDSDNYNGLEHVVRSL